MRDDSGTRVADRVRDRNDGTRIRTDNGGTGDEGEITIATPANDTSRMTVPALVSGGTTRAGPGRYLIPIGWRDRRDVGARVVGRRRNEGGTRAR